MLNSGDLTLQPHPAIAVVGEILWDLFPDSACLGGAPLNFAVHASRLGFRPLLLSALGRDDFGKRAAKEIESLGLDMSLLQWSPRRTGTASVVLDGRGQPSFEISRPAAYDDLSLSPELLNRVASRKPTWVYYGTLFAATSEGHKTLRTLLEALPAAARFYDVNLRHGFDSLELVAELLASANVVKLNEPEAERVGRFLGFPDNLETFCRRGAARFGWKTACVTLGERGCVLFHKDEFVAVEGEHVEVADTVGAGDAFAAALLHGLTMGWPAAEIGRFANRVGALVASRTGAIPEWTMLEAAAK